MQLHYKKLDKGKALIILHGLYGASDNWLNIAKNIDRKYCKILPDLRNHGLSTHSVSHNYSDMTEDILQLFKQEEINTATVIGHSMGGKLAMNFACLYPDNVEDLIIIDIAPKNYNTSEFQIHLDFNKNIIRILQEIELTNKKSYREISNEINQYTQDKRTIQLILKNIKRNKDKTFSWKINIQAITKSIYEILENTLNNDYIYPKRCLFIRGEHSDYIKNKDISLIESIFPLAKLISIPNCRHWIHYEQPQLLIEIINTYLKSET